MRSRTQMLVRVRHAQGVDLVSLRAYGPARDSAGSSREFSTASPSDIRHCGTRPRAPILDIPRDRPSCADSGARIPVSLMLYKTLSAAVYGIDANIIQVEVDCSGIKTDQDHFHTVGLPDAAVRESRDRVRAALKNCGYDILPPTSPSIWPPRILRRKAPASTCPWRSASSAPTAA